MIAAAQDNDDENEKPQNKRRLDPKRKTSGADLDDGERDQSHRRGEKQSPPAVRKWQLFVDRRVGEVSFATTISSNTRCWKYQKSPTPVRCINDQRPKGGTGCDPKSGDRPPFGNSSCSM